VELTLQPNDTVEQDASLWRNPAAWLHGHQLSRDYWVFFTAAFFFDFGFAVYFFLFNLFLLDAHFNERAIGLIGSAGMIGSVAGTLPVGLLARKYGLRPVLMVCFTVAPILGVLRLFLMTESAQICVGFLFGLSMSLWAVCFLPAVARTTTAANRQSAFSLITSAAIGTAMLGGIVCAYVPQWLQHSRYAVQPIDAKRLMLFVSCVIAITGLFAVLQMKRIDTPVAEVVETASETKIVWWKWKPDAFLLRFLPAMALWTVVVTSFNPFANIYLSKVLHVPFIRIGFIFSTAQMVQLCTGLLTPLLFRLMGLINGVIATQIAAALLIASLAGAHNPQIAVILYLVFSAVQWMAAPGMYNLLMSRVPDSGRTTAASAMMFCNAIVGAVASAATGALFTKFGYPPIMMAIAAIAVFSGIATKALIGRHGTYEPALSEG
jgi:MFS family permease